MSASGVRLFDDDLAADVRDLFVEYLAVLKNDGSYVLPMDFNKLREDLEENFGMSVDA